VGTGKDPTSSGLYRIECWFASKCNVYGYLICMNNRAIYLCKTWQWVYSLL
jgi:hypothetical protein